uniref:Phorbol-ester/DAG-type domain-containing protein n=1 Tax=Lygus hesperus TaxID=30085 RepID=A0A146KMH2_LYGHE
MVDEEVDDKPGVTPSPLVPIISVTPHSPAGKPYPILEDNLQQLHYIHESVQQMRDLALQPFTYQEASRLSSSCPSLNDAGSDPDLISSINSTPTQTLTVAAPTASRSLYHKRGSGEWELFRRNAAAEGECEVARRRSWAALEDLSHGKDSCKPGRQRSGNDLCSISLSSMESDMEDPFCESTANLLGTDDAIARVRQARTNPNSSTHSLNEADLQLVLRRHSGHQLHGTTGSDEDDVLDGVLVPAKGTTAFHYFSPAAFDDHPEKRRKRGSLFFRKKKEKTKKTPHQWVTVCYGNSQVCDLCSKSLTNKPSVYCENCTITAHQNSCKDNLAECKGKINKSNIKNGGLAKLAAKRGSSSNTSGSPSRRTTLCYSPWRRVATKLGVQ